MIGIFDSGLGGLGIFKEIKKLLPKESIFYYADNQNIPYGGKSKARIRKLTLKALAKIRNRGCKIIVIACNTATTSGIDYYRRKMNLSLIGVVPVIKTAAALTKNKKIALLATPLTNKNKYISGLIKKFAKDCRVKKISCPDWVNAIEQNLVTDQLLNKCLKKITAEDVVILGCTHFPLIKARIQKLIGRNRQVIDSNAAVARHVKRVMALENLFHPQKKPKYIFQGSDAQQNLLLKAKKYL